MADSVFTASARIVDIEGAESKRILFYISALRTEPISSAIRAEQVTGNVEVNSKIYAGHYTHDVEAYIGFSDKADLAGKVFNAMPLLDVARLSYKTDFILLVKPAELVYEMGGAIARRDTGFNFPPNIFINNAIASRHSITEGQRILMKFNPLLKPAQAPEGTDRLVTK